MVNVRCLFSARQNFQVFGQTLFLCFKGTFVCCCTFHAVSRGAIIFFIFLFDIEKIPYGPGNQHNAQDLVENRMFGHFRVCGQPSVPKAPQPESEQQTSKYVRIHLRRRRKPFLRSFFIHEYFSQLIIIIRYIYHRSF